VLSHLVIGLEPLAETRSSIDLLIDREWFRCSRTSSPYDGSSLRSRWTATPEEARAIYAHLYERLVRTRINPHWVSNTMWC
jgi:hypothetical protein